MSKYFDSKWNYPTEIHFGCGKIEHLYDLCQSLNIHKPLLVTDPTLARFDMVKNATQTNGQQGMPTGLFFDIQANPTGKNIMDGLAVYNNGGHDGVIAFGGGSAMDAGKTIALMVGQTHSWADFEDKDDNWLRVNAKTVPSIIAIPTTSGTGSEVSRAALIVDEETHSKRIISHPKMLPSLVICDPVLTQGVPPFITATTGMDALAHNLEAFCAPGFHPMADGIALEGMRLIKKWLPVAFQDGENIEARSYLMAAATMGSTAFQKGLGAIHSLSHPVGAIYGVHHGLLNAIFMPYVLEYNRDYIEDKMSRLAQYLDLEDQSLDGVIVWVKALNESLGIPKTLSELQVDDTQATEVVRQAMADGSTPSNPRPMDIESVKVLYLQALKG